MNQNSVFVMTKKKKSVFPTNVKMLACFIGPRRSLLPPIVCSHNHFSAVRTVPLRPQETSTDTRPSIVSPIWKRQVSRSQPQILIMSFSQQEERLQMGQKPPTHLVSRLLLKAEKAGAISQWMTKEHNNIHQTQEEKKKRNKKNFVVASLFIADCGKTVLRRALARLHHKLESLWWGGKGFISESDFM